MKKAFLAIILVLQFFAFSSFGAPATAFAQSSGYVVVTQEYLDAHPELKDQGVHVGDTVALIGDTGIVIPITGQVGGSGVNNAPINSGSAGTGTAGAPAQTTLPTYGSAKPVTTCDAIKLKSVLNILIWLKCIAGAIIIPLIFMAAFVVFLWGVLKFMMASSAEKRKESQNLIWWGLVGLFVMVSVWGILKIAGTTLGIDSSAVPHLQTDYLSPKNATP